MTRTKKTGRIKPKGSKPEKKNNTAHTHVGSSSITITILPQYQHFSKYVFPAEPGPLPGSVKSGRALPPSAPPPWRPTGATAAELEVEVLQGALVNGGKGVEVSDPDALVGLVNSAITWPKLQNFGT